MFTDMKEGTREEWMLIAAEHGKHQASAAPRQIMESLARLQVILRDRFPDVLADLLAVGGITLPTTIDLGDPRPGDEDLGVLIVRRTTLEWVLRSAALAQGLCESDDRGQRPHQALPRTGRGGQPELSAQRR